MNPARFLFSIWVTPVLLCSLQRIFIFILFKDNPFLSHTTIHFYPTTILFPIPLSISILVQNHFQNHSFPYSSLPSRLCLFSLSGTGIDSVTQLSSVIHQIMLLYIMNRYSSAMPIHKLPLVSKLPRSSCTIISAWLNCYQIMTIWTSNARIRKDI